MTAQPLPQTRPRQLAHMCRYGRLSMVGASTDRTLALGCPVEGLWVVSSSSAFIREDDRQGDTHVQKLVASLMAVGLLLLAACGTGGEVEPGPVTSFEDIAGIYEKQGRPYFAGYLHFFEDGTWHASSSRDLVEERPSDILETRFEGTSVFVKSVKGACVDDDPDATYEIHLLENGNLQLVLIEDMCGFRSGAWDGAEYAPVP